MAGLKPALFILRQRCTESRHGQREAGSDDRPLDQTRVSDRTGGLLRMGRSHQAENKEPEHHGQH